MKQTLLLILLYFSSLILNIVQDDGRGVGGEVNAQTTDTLKRDSLLIVLKNYELRKKELRQPEIIPADTQKANLLWEIFWCDDGTKNPDAQEPRLATIKKISDALNYKKGIANVLTGKACLLAAKQEYKKAIELTLQALKIRQEINDEKGIAWSYFYLGACNQWQNLYKDAAPWYYKAIKIAEKVHDSATLNMVYCGLSGIYESVGDSASATIAYEKSAIYAHTANGEYGYAFALIYLATDYINHRQLEKADSVLALAYKTSVDFKSNLHLSYYYNTYGSLCAAKGNIGEGILNLFKSNACEDSIQMSQNKPYNYRVIADYILLADEKQLAIAGIRLSKKYDEAIRYSQLSLDNTLRTNIMGETAFNYKNMSIAYEAKGDIAQAFKYYKMSTAIKDSLYNAESTKTIQGLKMQYESEKKEEEIKLLNKDKKIAAEEISRQQLQRNSLIGGFVIVMLIGFLAYNRFRIKQHTNRQLSVSLERLKHTQQQMVEQEKLAALGQLTAGIAHEIKNPLNFVNNFSELSKDLIDDLKAAGSETERKTMIAELKENNNRIKHHGQRAENIVNSMLLHSRDSSGEMKWTDLNRISEDVLHLSHKNFTLKFPMFTCEVETHFAERLPQVNCDREEITRVILNLLDNAFYAVRTKAEKINFDKSYIPRVTISTILSNHSTANSGASIAVSVKDNGIGIPGHIRQKIFDPFFTTKSTHEGTGLGLSICNDIIKAHGGTIEVNSKEGEGTEFVITLPV